MKDLFLSIRRGDAEDALSRQQQSGRAVSSESGNDLRSVQCADCGISVPSALTTPFGEKGKEHKCELCASYSTVGEKDPCGRGRDMAAHSLVAVIPELSGADLNLLHWAMAAAMEHPTERERATQVSQRLQARIYDAKHGYGSMNSAAYGQAMRFLSDGEYAMRDVTELRMVFSPALMRNLQGIMGGAHAAFADCDRWDVLTQDSRRQMIEGHGEAES
ncbi:MULTISPECIES: hypothetical protein [Achromobacter]|uniref:Uncharacterized protein n=1 Tax=Achromobacter mucicolens TaxID=1389922 RepID=A0ABM8LL32_9BURK|nr:MULTISPECIES: hypothetical protein [Achromobacter]AVG44150.1 hypothetical protein MC81_30525 [Achromobacter insolitus]CAB3846293.1 hypothetical protein LMG3410_01534 [Achromobacter aegrifaciens]CAB3913755.1 hypothetical protein LMG3415_05115 [Achromobacter mucicolens]